MSPTTLSPKKIRVHASLPYYELRVASAGGFRYLYGEAYIAPQLSPIYRASLITPNSSGLLEVPPPDSISLPPTPAQEYLSSIKEGISEILSSGLLEKPSFEFEGLKGLIKAVLTGGRYRASRPTRALEYKSAAIYIREVLNLTGEENLLAGRVLWRPIRTTIDKERGVIVLIEKVEDEEWVPDRLLLKLLRVEPPVFARLAGRLLSYTSQ